MPVIGRLDEQVDELIIAPIGGRAARDGRKSETGDEDAPTAPPREEMGKRGDTAERPAHGDELPVWLL